MQNKLDIVYSKGAYPESTILQRFNKRDFAVIKTPMTPLHSLLFSCSVMLVSIRSRLFHLSSSDRGPAFGSKNLETKYSCFKA